jgi:hypothetical protein
VFILGKDEGKLFMQTATRSAITMTRVLVIDRASYGEGIVLVVTLIIVAYLER